MLRTSLFLALAACWVPSLAGAQQAPAEPLPDSRPDSRPDSEGPASVQGRVLFDGAPVEGARVQFRRLDAARHERASHALWSRVEETPASGVFTQVVPSRGTYELRAWHPAIGAGRRHVELAGRQGRRGFDVSLDEPLCRLSGRVRVPSGQRPDELHLRVHGPGSMLPVRPDGAFHLHGLPPGPLVLEPLAVRGSGRLLEYPNTCMPWASTPSWMRVERTWLRDPTSGQHVHVELDLGQPAAYALVGSLRIDGAGPYFEQREPLESRTPQVRLGRLDGLPAAARTWIDDEGGFQLGAETAGTYLLDLWLMLEGSDPDERRRRRPNKPRQPVRWFRPPGSEPDGWPARHPVDWRVFDRVTLGEEQEAWEQDLPTGRLLVPPRTLDGRRLPFEGHVRWRGPGALRIEVEVPPVKEGPRLFRLVPAGAVELVLQDGLRAPSVVARATVEAGATTTLRWP